VALGVDFVEVDVRITADRRLVCIHDPTVAGVEVAGVAHADLVLACDAAGVPAPPQLGDVADRCRGRVRLEVELKVARIESQVFEEVGRASLDQTVFMSFDDGVVRALKRHEPSCVAGLHLGRSRSRWGGLSRLGELFPGWRLRACRADFVAPHQRLLKFGFAWRMRHFGRPVFVWTVNDAATMEALLSDVDGIITDEPGMLLALRAAASAAPPGAALGPSR